MQCKEGAWKISLHHFNHVIPELVTWSRTVTLQPSSPVMEVELGVGFSSYLRRSWLHHCGFSSRALATDIPLPFPEDTMFSLDKVAISWTTVGLTCPSPPAHLPRDSLASFSTVFLSEGILFLIRSWDLSQSETLIFKEVVKLAVSAKCCVRLVQK